MLLVVFIKILSRITMLLYISVYHEFIKRAIAEFQRLSRGVREGLKFDFAHVFMVDRLGRDKNYRIVLFEQNIHVFQRNMQITKFR